MIPGTHCTGGWVGPRAGLDTETTGKILSPLPGIEPRSRGRPVHSKTLYWLSYSAHVSMKCFHNILLVMPLFSRCFQVLSHFLVTKLDSLVTKENMTLKRQNRIHCLSLHIVLVSCSQTWNLYWQTFSLLFQDMKANKRKASDTVFYHDQWRNCHKINKRMYINGTRCHISWRRLYKVVIP
jgi:hypothetical protein